MICNYKDFVVRGNQCGTQCASLTHSTDCSNVDAAGAHTLDGSFSVHQGPASKDRIDLVRQSPLQNMYSIYIQLLL